MQPWRTSTCVAMALGGGLLAAAEDPFAGLNLETHGFVSFGYLKSWGNNWHGETLDGTDEFWEAAANVIARPMDHLRLGAQLFVRDLGVYGNGKVELDWAYADWRQVDDFGIQVGRVKIPFGIYSDIIDVDAARPSVFLPRPIYPTRAREILLSTDGGKIYGSTQVLDWALYAGQRQLQTDGDFASYFASIFQMDRVSEIDSRLLVGGMVHWHTPVEGLATRLTLAWLQDFELSGHSAVAPIDIGIEIPDWYALVLSVLYEKGDFTLASEFLRYYADQQITTTPTAGGPGQTSTVDFRDQGAYLSATWHARRWLDVYAALEGQWSDPTDLHGSPYCQAAVAALDVMPTSHWSLKVEYRYAHGTKDVDVLLNPGGIAMDWQVLALKTTVDF